jgi:hypothetical protein
MTKLTFRISRVSRAGISFVLAVLFLCVTLVPDVSTLVQAQNGCAPPDSTFTGWAQGTTVYYNISAFPAAIQAQLRTAFEKWTAANSTNGSEVTFAPADANHAATYTIQAGSYQINGIYSASGTNQVTTYLRMFRVVITRALAALVSINHHRRPLVAVLVTRPTPPAGVRAGVTTIRLRHRAARGTMTRLGACATRTRQSSLM